ncbi:hypothetical protein ACWCXB_27930 [Streptomyces sp. NPDC001514]
MAAHPAEGPGVLRRSDDGALLEDLDGRLGAAGAHGIIVMDGDGSDQAYQREHRKLRLRTRHIVEDPWYVGST